MGVKISVSTSTMQPPAPKISEVHFNILNLKNKKNGPISFVFSEISFVFSMWISRAQNKFLNKVCFLSLFTGTIRNPKNTNQQ